MNAIRNAASGATLNLTPGCTYVLTNSTFNPINTTGLSINKPLTIHGRNSTIQRSATAKFRLFTVNANFTLDRVRLREGDATTSPGGLGGAIAVNSGTTNLDAVLIQKNTATFSGGIGAVSGTVVNVTNSIIQGNSATRNGGGTGNNGRMTVANSVINGNRAGEKGGGIANDGTLAVVQSLITRNEAGTVGGGIANFVPGTVTVTRSLVNSNKATTAPGGIDNENGVGAVVRSAAIVQGNTPTNCSPVPAPSVSPVTGCRN
ncbi:hypothetical protein AB0K40_42940 [Nonomuraea bangladeshensis]|uniref:Right-handed parallel beta-helix repeat-containing protein n=1 Tax=Nonomuraea bangladeshensis TaxID=404385 RepID=A0ABV3HIE0_9ACTN